jgi:hypothetical protein
MASGHDKFFDDEPGNFAELVRVRRAHPVVQDWLRRYRRTDREFHIPYLSGVSTDGSCVYIDHALPLVILRNISLGQLLIIHETVEYALMRGAGLKYEPAHHLATAAEAYVLRVIAPGTEWNDYRAVLRPYYKPVQDATLTEVPQDLALYPYSGRLYKDLWDLQHGKITKTKAGYRQTASAVRCGSCSMFRPVQRSCTLVVGRIRAADTCDRWEPRAGAEEGRQTAVGQAV